MGAMETIELPRMDGNSMSLWKLAMFYGDGTLLWMFAVFYEDGMWLWRLAILMETDWLYKVLLCFKDEAVHDSVWGQEVVIDQIIISLQQMKTISFKLIRKNIEKWISFVDMTVNVLLWI